MNLEPLATAPFSVQLHVAAVVPAAIIGTVLLFRRKGTRLHKLSGRIWVALMVVASVSSFFIHQIDLLWGFSPIHILSVLVLVGCARAVAAARSGQIDVHRSTMQRVYIGGIMGAGFFAFMPGRIMNAVLFPLDVQTATLLAVLALAISALALLWHYRQRRATHASAGKAFRAGLSRFARAWPSLFDGTSTRR